MIPWILFAVSAGLRLADGVYYANERQVLSLLRLGGDRPTPGQYYRRFDALFACFPFLWSWLEIFALAMLVKSYPSGWLGVAAAFYAATRYRALQEASHTAVHRGLCRSKWWQWILSDLFFQFPALKPDMEHRYTAHVTEHHHHPNDPSDPNVRRFAKLGFLPGLSRARFYLMLFHPLTPVGFMETLRLNLYNVTCNASGKALVLRVIATTAFPLALYATGGLRGLWFAYLLPLFTLYPWFSWISLLVEHRWFAKCEAKTPRERECANGRPTDYPGLTGWIIKHSLFPGTDHYHLAHSLYPFLRWNYLPGVDRALKDREPDYSRHRSTHLFFGQPDRPSALSELHDRMTGRSHPTEVAEWLERLPS